MFEAGHAAGFAVRPPAVAGMFYPGEPAQLSAQIAGYLAQVPRVAEDASAPAPKVLVVPHAGYVYSGPVAAFAYARLARWADRFTRVVLLGPTHRVAVNGLAVPQTDAFDTPLGRVPIDRAALSALADLPQIVRSDAAHASEHSLEVQLPFLQTVLRAFTLVPLAVGRASAHEVAQVLERLWGGDETLIVISSDLSHYLPYSRAQSADRATVARILQFDETLGHDDACGATPLAGAARAARAHGLVPRLLDLRNSGDTAGDRSRVVGYCAIAYEPGAAALQSVGSRDAHEAPGDTPGDDGDPALGAALISRARNAMAAALRLPLRSEPDHPLLRRHGATFVSLHHQGVLRGCVGRLEATRPLEDDVRSNAVAAAFQDPRFAPVQRAEYASLEVEVSVLEAPQPIIVRSEAEALAAARPGVDGIVLQWREQRATFLPQVWEQLPDPQVFFAALKRKAGLAPGFWAQDVQVSRYRVRRFEESNR